LVGVEKLFTMSTNNISPDIQEWLLLDNQVCSSWIRLAVGLGLQHHVNKIVRQCEAHQRSDRHKLGQLIGLWRHDKPHLFTLDTLLTILRDSGLKTMEMWIRIITSRHYQDIRREISRRRHSQTSVTWMMREKSVSSSSLLNVSQDSGVGDMFSSSLWNTTINTLNTSDDELQDQTLLSPPLVCHSHLSHIGKHDQHNIASSSTPPATTYKRVSLPPRGRKGSVFDILYKPEGKALTRISEAWIENMKNKKRLHHRWRLKDYKNSSDPHNFQIRNNHKAFKVEKYFDNLVTILHHSVSCIEL